MSNIIQFPVKNTRSYQVGYINQSGRVLNTILELPVDYKAASSEAKRILKALQVTYCFRTAPVCNQSR